MAPRRDWAASDYSRIYHSVITDSKFAAVYDDDQRWAWYTRLLMAADGSYPAPPPIPRAIPDDVLDVLAELRIIEIVRSTHYRVVALLAEREGRGSGRAAGGRARVAGAQRDESGRFLAGSDAGDAGALLDDAGPSKATSEPEPANPAKPSRVRDETRDSPQPPAGGGHGSRANGTSPRQLRAAAAAEAETEQRRRAAKRQAAELAYYRGEITESQKRDTLRELGYIVDEPEHWFDAPAPAEAPA